MTGLIKDLYLEGTHPFLDLSYYYARPPQKVEGKHIYFMRVLEERDISYARSHFNFYSEVVRDQVYFRELMDLFHDNDDWRQLEDTFLHHGIFLRDVFQPRFERKIRNIALQKKERAKNLWDRYTSNSNSNLSYSHKWVFNTFARQYFFGLLWLYAGKSMSKSLIEWHNARLMATECEVCGRSYYFLNVPDWVYRGSNGNQNTCFQCPVSDAVSRDMLLLGTKSLVERLGFIPQSNASPIFYPFTSRIPKGLETIIFKEILGIGGYTNGGGHFESWFHVLNEAGCLLEGQLATSRGIKSISKSGNLCLSLEERYIDEFFFEKGIQAQKEPLYPYHPIHNKSGRKRADWKVGKYYVEYFGLKGNKSYDKKTETKFKLVEALELDLIPIFPDDINSLDKIFSEFTK